MPNLENSDNGLIGSSQPAQDVICVLAGGESRRFGRSKLLVQIDGMPILTWLAQRLSTWKPHHRPCQLWLSLPFGNTPLPDGSEGYGKIIRDPLPFQGPLAGIAAVLQSAPESGVIAFVAGDMPCIQTHHLDTLFAAMRNTPGAVRSCFETPDLSAETSIRLQPLPMVMDLASAHGCVCDAMEKGMRGPSGLARRDDCKRVSLSDQQSGALLNINTPLDLEPISRFLNARVEAKT